MQVREYWFSAQNFQNIHLSEKNLRSLHWLVKPYRTWTCLPFWSQNPRKFTLHYSVQHGTLTIFCFWDSQACPNFKALRFWFTAWSIFCSDNHMACTSTFRWCLLKCWLINEDLLIHPISYLNTSYSFPSFALSYFLLISIKLGNLLVYFLFCLPPNSVL